MRDGARTKRDGMTDQDMGPRQLGELEAAIMEVVWVHEPVTVRAVRGTFSGRRALGTRLSPR